MPKIKWLTPVKADHVKELITRYMQGRKLTYAEIAKDVGMTMDSAKTKKSRGGGSFTVDDLRKWGKALGIPPEEIGQAVAADMS